MLIKTAILMPEAKEGEVTIVEVETVGFNKTKVDALYLNGEMLAIVMFLIFFQCLSFFR